MAQHDFNIANQTFPATRIDLNNAWAAIVSNSSGATAPSTTYAYQFWYDTNTDTLKIRNTDNDAWISLFVLNQTTDTITSVDGRDIAVDGSKLDGIEAGATADQTAAEIRALVESAIDSNVFTNADHSKLNGIEASATADQTASEILTAIKTVDGAASGLDADLLDGQQGSYYTGYTDTAVANLVDSAPAALDTLNELAAALGDDANFSTTVTNSIATKLPLAGGTMTGNISFAAGQTFDGRDVSADGSKLDGIEAGATADQTGAEIKAAYEAEANAFTDAQFTKLAGIETSADVTDTTNVTAAGALMDSEVTNLAQVKAFDSSDYATAAQGTTADAALPRSGGAMTGAITTNSTFDGRDVATDGAKLDGIAAGANNYVHPNHTGEVTSTADGATVIADNVVDEANLKVSNAPTNGYALTAQSGAAGGLTWAAVSGGSYSDSDVDTHLNTSTAATNEVLSWNGTDYDWVAQSGGGSALELYDENPSSPTANTASGTNAVAIGGYGAIASGKSSFAVGADTFDRPARASGGGSIALGGSNASGDDAFAAAIDNNSTSLGARGNNSIAMGWSATALGTFSVAIGGQNSYAAATKSGAFLGGYADGDTAIAIGNAYASGTDSFAAAIDNNTSSYGATGANSIAMGYQAKSTASGAVSIGDRNTASGEDAVVLGESNTGSGAWSFTAGKSNTNSGSRGVALGNSHTVSSFYTFASGSQNTASQDYAHALGSKSLADRQGKLAHASLGFGTVGDSQYGRMVLSKATTDATPTILTALQGNSPVAANMPVIPTGGAQAFSGLLVAKQTGSANAAAWEIKGLIVNNGGTTTLVNSAITVIDNTPSWGGPAITADNTNNWLAITCTGAAATSIRWSCTLNTSELIYA